MIPGIAQPDLAAGDKYYAKGPDVLRIAQEVKAMGINNIRFDAAWMFIDPNNNGNYRWADMDRAFTACRDVGLDILLTIEPRTRSNAANFGKLCKAIAQRYIGEIAYFEIGNEVNSFGNSVKPKSPATFVEFQKQAWDNITPYAPDALVFAAALMAIGTGPIFTLSPIEWTQGFINSNGLDYCHGLSMHPYMRSGHDYVAQLPTADNWSLKNIEALRAMIDNAGGTDKLIACTEFGYSSMTSPSGLSVTAAEIEAEQAANVEALWDLLKAYADAGTIFEIAWPFTYRDWEQPDRKDGYHYGIVHNDYTPKPAKTFFQSLATPWDGNVSEGLSISESVTFDLRPDGLFIPVTETLSIAESVTFELSTQDGAHVSTGGGDTDSTVGLETILTWTHVVTATANGALTADLDIATDHLKDWRDYNTLTVESLSVDGGPGDGQLTRLASRHIGASSVKKGSVHIFGLANADNTPKPLTVGTHTMKAHVKLNNDFVTNITQVNGNSDLYQHISKFGLAYSNGNASGIPNVEANSADGNIVHFAFGCSNNMTGLFNKTQRYAAGASADGDGDYILTGDAPGANTVKGQVSVSPVRYGALAIDLIHA